MFLQMVNLVGLIYTWMVGSVSVRRYCGIANPTCFVHMQLFLRNAQQCTLKVLAYRPTGSSSGQGFCVKLNEGSTICQGKVKLSNSDGLSPLQNTQKQIVRGTASLCAKILESRNEKSLNVNLAQNDLDQSLRGNDGVDIDRKIGYYRNATYRRFSTSVHLIVDPSRKCKPNLEYQHKHGTSKVSLDFQDDLVGEQLSPTGFEVEMDHYQLIESVDHTSGELEGAIDAKETDEMLTMQEVEGEDWKDVSGTVILRRSGPEEGQNLRDDIESNEVFTNDIKDEDWNNEPETLSDSDEDKLKVGKNKRKYAARKFKRDVLTRYFGKCKFGNRVRFLSKEVRNLKFIFDDKHPFERSWEGKWTCSTCQHSFYGKKELLAHLAGTCNGLQRKNLEQEETEDNAQTEEIDAGNSFNEKIYIAIEDPLFRSFKNRLKKIGDSLFLLDEKCRFKCTKTLWRCISCDLPFQRKCRLRDHLNYCPGDPSTDASEAHRYRGCIYDKLKCGNFQCRFCRILCSSDEAMIGHLKECHVGKFNRDRDKPSYVEVEPNKYVCNQKFPFELVDENFKCGTCFKNFSMRSEIVTHIQKEHLVAAQKRRAVFSNPSPGKFIAEGFSFEKIGDEYKCDHCTYSSLKLTAIKDHLRRCHMDVKKVPCQLCEKRFNSGGDLRKHVKQVHKKERPYICELCGKSFKIMCSLRIHRAQVHPESSDKNFSCEICGKIYGSMALLRVHAKRHETVVCHLCGKDMISAKLAYHLARHNEENECGRV
ncbi:unnamed protein product [Allacma fusca]|uniref:C2H2-type domain-containing protein n=1 Tax=Allacma fusca TaxID=39272 RepID=A0A8J2KVC0_9HEXA|nr:unnamed protein product [Allacma fusca]